MDDKYKGFIGIAIFIIVLAGLSGLISGDGFLGGIGNEADAIGDLLSFLIKLAIGIGVVWLLIGLFKDKDDLEGKR